MDNVYLDLCRAEARAIAAEQKARKDEATIEYVAMMADIEIPEDEKEEGGSVNA